MAANPDKTAENDPLADIKADAAKEAEAAAAKGAETEGNAEENEEEALEEEAEAQSEQTDEQKQAAEKAAAAKKEERRKNKRDWRDDRIGELTAKVHEKDNALKSLSERLSALESKPAVEAAAEDGTKAPKTEAQIREEIRAEERAAAERDRTIREYNEIDNGIYTAGSESFGKEDFDEALSNYKALGGLTVDIILVANDAADGNAGNAAKILYNLGQNPQELARVMKLPPTKMAVAMAKVAASRPKTEKDSDTKVSKAPKPPANVDTNGRVDEGFGDEVPDDVFTERLYKTLDRKNGIHKSH